MYNDKQRQQAKDTIVEKIATGSSLKSILDNDENLPGRTTIYKIIKYIELWHGTGNTQMTK